MTAMSIQDMTELVAPLGEPHRSKVRDYIRKLENRLALAESALEAARAEEVRVLREALIAISDEYVTPIDSCGYDLELPRHILLKVRAALEQTK